MDAEHSKPENFLRRMTCLTGAVGLACSFWVLLGSLNPSAAVLTPEWVDLSDLPPGHRKTVHWGPMPIFIAHRTAEEIAQARALDDEYKERTYHPFGEPDESRVQRAEWVVVQGQQPFGNYGRCRLSGQKAGEFRGELGGWYDPCYRRAYDTSGRIMAWHEWANLWVPPYRFTGDTEIAFPYQR